MCCDGQTHHRLQKLRIDVPIGGDADGLLEHRVVRQFLLQLAEDRRIERCEQNVLGGASYSEDVRVSELQHRFVPCDDEFEFRVRLLDAGEDCLDGLLLLRIAGLQVLAEGGETLRRGRSPGVHDEGVRMCLAEAVVLLQERDLRRILLVGEFRHDAMPIRHRLSVLLLDRREVGIALLALFRHAVNVTGVSNRGSPAVRSFRLVHRVGLEPTTR